MSGWHGQDLPCPWEEEKHDKVPDGTDGDESGGTDKRCLFVSEEGSVAAMRKKERIILLAKGAEGDDRVSFSRVPCPVHRFGRNVWLGSLIP
jgi:hypothetical protein